jgi:integrase
VPGPRSAAHIGGAAARGGRLAHGVHPKVVQERLGHSQISVTLDTYSHVLPTMQAEAAGKFDDMLVRGVRVDRWVKVMDVHRVMM